MHTLKLWILASRPKTLSVSVSSVFTGIALALSDGIFEADLFFFTLFAALTIQIGTNLANDYFDFIKGADTINRKGPLRVTQAGLIAPLAMKRAIAITFSLTALSGAYLIWHGGLVIALFVGLAIFLGIIYTGGPFPIAYLGLGEFFTFIFFGPISVASTYYLQTKQFSYEAILAGFAPGALSWAILAMNNLRDREEDLQANKKTICVRFGKAAGKCSYITALAIAIFTPLLFIKEHPFALLASLTLFPALSLIFRVIKNNSPHELVPVFEKTAQLSMIYTLLFIVGWML